MQIQDVSTLCAFDEDPRANDIEFIKFLEQSHTNQVSRFVTPIQTEDVCDWVVITDSIGRVCRYNLSIYKLCNERNLPAPYDARSVCNDRSVSYQRRMSCCSSTEGYGIPEENRRRGSTCGSDDRQENIETTQSMNHYRRRGSCVSSVGSEDIQENMEIVCI